MVADQRKDTDWEPDIICDRCVANDRIVNSQMDIGTRGSYLLHRRTRVVQGPVMASRSYGDGNKMSLLGQKATFAQPPDMSGLPPIADSGALHAQVR